MKNYSFDMKNSIDFLYIVKIDYMRLGFFKSTKESLMESLRNQNHSMESESEPND